MRTCRAPRTIRPRPWSTSETPPRNSGRVSCRATPRTRPSPCATPSSAAAGRSGDLTSARKDIDKLQSLHDALEQAKNKYWAEQTEIQRRAAAAWVARAEGKKDAALALMRSA